MSLPQLLHPLRDRSQRHLGDQDVALDRYARGLTDVVIVVRRNRAAAQSRPQIAISWQFSITACGITAIEDRVPNNALSVRARAGITLRYAGWTCIVTFARCSVATAKSASSSDIASLEARHSLGSTGVAPDQEAVTSKNPTACPLMPR